jgi:hypothetical protein
MAASAHVHTAALSEIGLVRDGSVVSEKNRADRVNGINT